MLTLCALGARARQRGRPPAADVVGGVAALRRGRRRAPPSSHSWPEAHVHVAAGLHPGAHPGGIGGPEGREMRHDGGYEARVTHRAHDDTTVASFSRLCGCERQRRGLACRHGLVPVETALASVDCRDRFSARALVAVADAMRAAGGTWSNLHRRGGPARVIASARRTTVETAWASADGRDRFPARALVSVADAMRAAGGTWSHLARRGGPARVIAYARRTAVETLWREIEADEHRDARQSSDEVSTHTLDH